MPTLRIPFPEKETPSFIELRGPRITIGRLADNTIQIRDRTVSAHHAELIEEDGHYRLHDLGATNGIVANGESVLDFHLREACKIAFGAIECEFSPEPPPEGAAVDPTRALVTRVECEGLIRENGELKEKITALTEQIERIQASHTAAPDAPTVPQTEYDRVVAEVAALKETVAARDREMEKVQGHLALLRRDHGRLQSAMEEGTTRAIPRPSPTPAPSPAAEQAKLAAPSAPAKPAAPATPAVDEQPIFVRATPPAAAPAAPSGPMAPSAPSLPKPPAKLQPSVPLAPAASSAPAPMRPFPPAAKPVIPVAAKSKPSLAGVPTVKAPVVPLAKASGTPTPTVAGPKGTQKIQG